MGSSNSRNLETEKLEHKLHAITHQMALIVEAGSDEKWEPESLNGVIVQTKRADGSSVKELYVPQWDVSFFMRNSEVAVRRQPTVLEGKPVRIIIAHSILLHNLYIKSKDYNKAGDIAKVAFSTYISDGDVIKN